MDAMIQGHMRFGDELRAKGRWSMGAAAPDATAAASVQGRQVMDGPFTETKEALGGFYLIECDTKQEALEWAKKVPLGEGGFIEVRPIWPM
jgi:hypothetical protein